ncbi:unnamed protein product [Effrenium voratum]|nr:unnamed protein product [Effrenium voratum]|mmetsp:Transcript_30057/g.71500  ORF Transcript_30057/g.71500 Transcript_30057/m.71500 type:complete len:732 (+) Transcript_30057:43-2238(+)
MLRCFAVLAAIQHVAANKTRGPTFIQAAREVSAGRQLTAAQKSLDRAQVVDLVDISANDAQRDRFQTSTTTTQVAMIAVTGRRLNIINKCARPMIMHVTGGNSEVPCGSGCPTGMTCNPIRQLCYFDMPAPSATSGWTILAGEQVQIFTPNEPIQQGNGVTADWSGKLEFYPNVTMDGGLASSALCNGAGKCPTYQGLNGVATAVEFTFVPHGSDYYDVSIINGFNVGIEMKPDRTFRAVFEGASGGTRGYNCGAAGASAQPDRRISPCSYSFQKSLRHPVHVDISPLMIMVDGGRGSCAGHADCSGIGIVCGQVAKTVFDSEAGIHRPTTEISMECGRPIGTWSVYQLCVWSGNAYRSPPPYEGLIDCISMHDMFACAGPLPWPVTCYGKDVMGGECCGCANWTEVLGIPVPEGGEGCTGFSPTWKEAAQPFYEILKEGCPTAYTYAFDDETSTFTCRTAESVSSGMPNKVGYDITLCPEGSDFAPMRESVEQACRGSDVGDNQPEYYTREMGLSLGDCKAKCRNTAGCKGVEYGLHGHCEVWTRPAGIQATAPVPGFQCLRFIPHEFETVGDTDEACQGDSAMSSTEALYWHFANETVSGCQQRCRMASDVCRGVELGPEGCTVWTQGIESTKPAAGYSCHAFLPSDFELVGTGASACRGSTWYDNSVDYFTHVKQQTLTSCKELCRGMGSRCKGIEFGPYGRCELWTRDGGIQAERPLDGYNCYRYVP